MVVPAVAISTVLGALNGYVLTKWRFRGDTWVFGLLLFGCFIPFQMVLIPMARLLGLMGIAGTVPGLIFVHLVYGIGFSTLYFKNYYQQFPTELVRAAMIDGAGFFTIFRRIMLPSSGPIAVVCVIWQFTNIWNDFLFGASFSDFDSQPMTVALEQPRPVLDGREGIQRAFRRGDHGRAAHAPRLRRRRPVLRARADGGLGERIRSMGFLDIKRATKSYGAVKILHETDISIEEGEFLVLVGPSGCGKSTLLNMIAGLEEVTTGDIAIKGRSMNGVRPAERNIAMVFQCYALYPNMNVGQNIAFGLEMHGVPKPERDKAMNQVAELLQIKHLLDRKPGQLSGGQRQRVAMGRALVRDPDVFLFDEPLSNLDAKLRVDMRTEIKKLHQKLEDHHRLRHPRPDRGADALDPDRGDVRRPRAAARHAEGDLRQPGQHLRRRLHGLAVDEPLPGEDRGRERPPGGRRRRSPAAARRRCPSPKAAASSATPGARSCSACAPRRSPTATAPTATAGRSTWSRRRSR